MPGGVSKSTQRYGGKFTIHLFINLFIYSTKIPIRFVKLAHIILKEEKNM